MIVDGLDMARAGSMPTAARGVQFSCSEVEALCLKAARGAGMSWGMAEEAGFAARWLSACGVDGPAAILALLTQIETTSSSIDLVNGFVKGTEGVPMCPIAVGTALSDLAPCQPERIQTATVGWPVLVVPFLQQVARVTDCPMSVVWPGGQVAVSGDGEFEGGLTALAEEVAAELSIAMSDTSEVKCSHAKEISGVSADVIESLNHYAEKTYVPASATSRADAGSAGSDND